MESYDFTPSTFDEFLTGRGIFWFCDDSYKVTPQDMDKFIEERTSTSNQGGSYRLSRQCKSMPALSACTLRTVYFSFPENVQPAPSPASSQTPLNGSSSSLSSMSGSHGDRRRVSCTFCRMPLCGEFIMCKEREEKSQKKISASRYGNADVDRPRCFNWNG